MTQTHLTTSVFLSLGHNNKVLWALFYPTKAQQLCFYNKQRNSFQSNKKQPLLWLHLICASSGDSDGHGRSSHVWAGPCRPQWAGGRDYQAGGRHGHHPGLWRDMYPYFITLLLWDIIKVDPETRRRCPYKQSDRVWLQDFSISCYSVSFFHPGFVVDSLKWVHHLLCFLQQVW